MQTEPLDFPRMGIRTAELVEEVERLLLLARDHADELGPINWADLSVHDVEYRLSLIYADSKPACHVIVEEAAPDSKLGTWINDRLDKARFPDTYVECEW